MSLDGGAAIARARGLVGQARYPQGRCLANVWEWFRAGSSTGRAAGRMSIALNAWLYSDQQHPGDRNPPVGVPVHFGVSPTRTDANKRAGDIALSIGGGFIIATDVVGARIGITTISARETQTARPYLGWCGDLGGHDIDWVGESHTSPTSGASATPIETPKATEETPMFLSRHENGTIGLFGIPGSGHMLFQSPDHYNMFRNVLSDSGVKLAGGIDMPEFSKASSTIRTYPGVTFDNLVIAHTPPQAPAPAGVDPAAVAKEIVAVLKTTTALQADVDETAVAAALTPLITKGVLDGMANRLKS